MKIVLKPEGDMKVPGVIFASPKLMKSIKKGGAIEQIKNVAALPGIVQASFAMPDVHQGYGFPIGGVAGFDVKEGIVSPGGIGYDINCGVRLLVGEVFEKQAKKRMEDLARRLFRTVPAGIGKETGVKVTKKDFDEMLDKGLGWALKNGMAQKEDLDMTEDGGCLDADNKMVSKKAKERGMRQLGTVGSGNHFIEIGFVDRIFDSKIASVFGLENGVVTVMIHTGSRSLGHQVASDYIESMENEYKFAKRDLACAPITSEIGKRYLKAMGAAANFAFVNRQIITQKTREIFEGMLGSRLNLVYDIAHNIAKFENVNGKKLLVHRKGATRSFGKGRREIPLKYRKVGCPLFLPGSMGTFSYVMAGTGEAEMISMASCAHGAGREIARARAMRDISPSSVRRNLEKNGIILMAKSEKSVPEEAPEAYKDVSEVARVCDESGLGKIVARIRPLAVIKG